MKFFKNIKFLCKKKNINISQHEEYFYKLCNVSEQIAQESGCEVTCIRDFKEIGSRLSLKKLLGKVLVIQNENITHKLTLQLIFTREVCIISIRLKSIKTCEHHKNRIKKILAEKTLLKEVSRSWNFKITKRWFKSVIKPSDKEKEFLSEVSKFIKMINNEHSFNHVEKLY